MESEFSDVTMAYVVNATIPINATITNINYYHNNIRIFTPTLVFGFLSTS